MTTLYTRDQWGALPLGSISRFTNPEFIFIHHTTGATLGRDQSDDWVRSIDRQHKFANGWAGIGYSWLFDTYGQIFEGRGWGVVGAHTLNWNTKGHGFAYLGDGDKELTGEAWDALRFLISESDHRYRVTQIVGHRDKFSTHCPGDVLYQHIPTLRDGVVVPPVVPGTNSPVPTHIDEDGGFGPQTITALQDSLNSTGANPRLDTDGIYGPSTKRALQGRLNYTNGPVVIDGVVGANTVRALQHHVGAGVDGAWGRDTTKHLQQALNAKRF